MVRCSLAPMFPMTLRPFLMLICCLALTACGSGEAGTEESAAPSALTVSTVQAERKSVERGVVASGPVSAWEEMQLGVEVSGLRITSLRVDVGQEVKAGQVLLELDSRALKSELSSANAALNEAKVGADLARVNLRRSQSLAESQLVSQSALDESRGNLSSAEARQATARAQADNARLRYEFATLRAPAAGVISKRLVQPGQVVSAGTELLRLIRDGRLEWRADLSEEQLSRVKVGAVVELASRSGKVMGRVRAVSPGVDSETRTGTVYVDLPEPGALSAGSFVEGQIKTGMEKVLVVPSAAIVQRDGFPNVFLVEGNKVRRQRVQTGPSNDGSTEIREGIQEGDRIALDGAGFLGDGDTVRIVENKGAP